MADALQLGIAQRCARGETLCGDSYLVHRGGSSALFAVIDGLGHGPAAHRAAVAARQSIAANTALDLMSLMLHVNRAIGGTRGAAISLLRIHHDPFRLRCGGVGNVEIGALSERPIRPVTTPGIVGRKFRKMHLFEYQLTAGDRLCVCSDGISRRHDLEDFAHLPAQPAAEAILAEHGADHDDATCLIIDC